MKEEGIGQKIKHKSFVMGLLHWNQHENSRKMPWKGEKDPYKIWLSEIILQQTRVAQGTVYYERFIAAYPTVHHLANAPEQEVFKLWEGLGYYTRCRNLVATARHISRELDGRFPDDYPSILALKGVGPYTAAAISSFAYNLPHAVLDGNVFRVLARVFGIEQPVDSREGKRVFGELADRLLPPAQAGIYNQAIMDFGATVCKPMPECAVCFFRQGCGAFQQHRQLSLPVKEKSLVIRNRWFHYFVLQWQDEFAIRKREGADIWQNLYEPLLLEGDEPLHKNALLAQLEKTYAIREYEMITGWASSTQRLTHQKIHFLFLHLLLPGKPCLEDFIWVPGNKIPQYPFPKTVSEFMYRNLTA